MIALICWYRRASTTTCVIPRTARKMDASASEKSRTGTTTQIRWQNSRQVRDKGYGVRFIISVFLAKNLFFDLCSLWYAVYYAMIEEVSLNRASLYTECSNPSNFPFPASAWFLGGRISTKGWASGPCEEYTHYLHSRSWYVYSVQNNTGFYEPNSHAFYSDKQLFSIGEMLGSHGMVSFNILRL